MRHKKRTIRLNLNSAKRRSLFRCITSSLFKHEQIKTTLARAKALRVYAEPLITLAKTDGVAARRLAFARIRDKEAVTKLFQDIAPRFQKRPGGYLRVLKCGYRVGDKAPMAVVQLVDKKTPTDETATNKKAGRLAAKKT